MPVEPPVELPWYCVGCNAEHPTSELAPCSRCGYWGRSSNRLPNPPIQYAGDGAVPAT